MSSKPRSSSSPRTDARPGRLLPWLALAFLIIVLDQITKILIVQRFQLGDGQVITGFFNLVRVHNTGAAFSFLAQASGWQRWFFIGLGFAASAMFIWMLRSHAEQRLFAFSVAMLLGGALGNVIDRLIHGHVIDFIQVYYQHYYWPAFNLADSAICLGAALMVLDSFRQPATRKPA